MKKKSLSIIVFISLTCLLQMELSASETYEEIKSVHPLKHSGLSDLITGLKLLKKPRQNFADVQNQLEQALAKGNYLAAYALGLQYASGNSVEQDKISAAKYFAIACSAGIPQACTSLSTITAEQGSEVNKKINVKKELEELRRALEINQD